MCVYIFFLGGEVQMRGLLCHSFIVIAMKVFKPIRIYLNKINNLPQSFEQNSIS